ncbi:DUF5683 domain-containing protein [Adhaeribacter radiodurans]|uniref:DUF5683 domain-containing protein n=1 Tax=Adhaeribacter radiodurans TaxID=2745197 RepID=A0A7L7L5D7_9BACT|nr:DUF5683 domain-containing protein [Adhaeribacter radiodurans]QMU27990.1 hypothetical protein HUW48_08000 [Adhaeribacter radiodurans]
MAVAHLRVFLLLALLCSTCISKAQVITTGSDSTVVSTTTTNDTLSTGIFGSLKSWDKPSRAALYSAIIPGAGQFYNKSYWKIPVLYAGGAVLGYFLQDNHKKYLLYRSSLEILNAGGEDRFAKQIPDKTQRFQSLSRAVQNFRRYRDYNIIFAILLYGLNVSEAYVDAHLKGFDISDELSLRIEPSFLTGPSYGVTPGISVRLNFKKQ